MASEAAAGGAVGVGARGQRGGHGLEVVLRPTATMASTKL
jgi:hypothetical protein